MACGHGGDHNCTVCKQEHALNDQAKKDAGQGSAKGQEDKGKGKD